jgi:hypothetical protein
MRNGASFQLVFDSSVSTKYLTMFSNVAQRSLPSTQFADYQAKPK